MRTRRCRPQRLAVGLAIFLFFCTALSLAGAAQCSYSISPTSKAWGASGGTGTLSVSVGSSCSWAVYSMCNFVQPSISSGMGSKSFSYTVDPNDGATRSGTLEIWTVGDIQIKVATFTVTQTGLNCTFSTNPASSSTFPKSGGTGAVDVITSNSACGWVSESDCTWIDITSGGSGPGTKTLHYSVDANPTTVTRTGYVVIWPAGDAPLVWFLVTQSGANCAWSINPTSNSFGASGGTGTVNVTVTAGAGCAWTATSAYGWITITSVSGSPGSGTVDYSVAANTGGARTGTLGIAGKTFTVTQAAGACTYTINPTGVNVAAAGGTGTVAVTAGAGCSWTATANQSWITITSGSSGSGNGTVGYWVAANTGAARTGSMTIAGKSCMVSQNAAPVCTYSINPTSASIGAAGGSGTVAVTTGAGCTWTATRNVTWITITSGSSGSGNGTVGYTVAQNTGAARTGTLTIAGSTFQVSQAAGACTFTISPTSAWFGPAVGTGSVKVTTGTGCSWTASKSVTWITFTSPTSGSGTATVSYTVAKNTTGATRTGTVTIAGKTCTVTQGTGCSYTLSATAISLGPATCTRYVTLTAPLNCAWTASSNTTWLTIQSATSGSGSTSVKYNVAAYSGTVNPRIGKLTIGGKVFTVTQYKTCTYTLSPASASFMAAGGTGTVSVATMPNCSWTAKSNVTWITITSGASGTGSGSVKYTVAKNTSGATRTGTLTIAGKTFTISQNKI